MAAYVPLELSKFSKNCKYLRRVLNETVSAFDEITRTEFFSQDELQSIGIYPKDHASLMSTLNRSPCILVLGYSRRARAQVVNELFCRRMLPVVRDPPLEKPEIKDANVINSESSHPEGPSEDFDKPVGYWPWRAVRFRHGSGNHAHHGGVSTATISLMLPNSFELIENLASHQKPYSTIPRVDLELTPEQLEEPSYFSSTLEVTMKHVLLRDDSQVIVAPCHLGFSKTHPQTHYWSRFLNNTLQDVLPVCIYALSGHSLCPEEVDELRLFKELAPQVPIFFLVVATSPASPSSHLTECEQHELQQHENNRASEAGKGKISFEFKANTSGRQRRHTSAQSSFRSPSPANESKTRLSAASLQLHRQLSQLGFSFVNVPVTHRVRRGSASLTVSSELCEQVEGLPGLLPFARLVLQSYLITASSTLYDTHHRCLRMFILSAFDWARQMQITPRRIEYARKKEAELYSTLLGVASKKQEEIRTLIVDTLATMQNELLDKAEQYVFQGVEVDNGEQLSPLQLQRCTDEIQDMVLNTLNSAVAEKLIGSVEYLRERFIGTLQRCLESLERSCRQAGEEVQASNALKQILTAAYQVQITVRTSSSFIRSLWEHFRNLLRALPWSCTPRLDAAWKRNVAENMLESLSEAKMARLICAQFRERLRSSHDAFQAALRQMETAHSGRLERTEEQCLRVRKVHAPRVARLALEAISLRDMVLYGMPQLGRELGRGQYGVVYGCETWGGYSPCAVKSVVPPDDKHWNDLSLEFYYSRMVPEHDRIITIRGSVIDHSYGVGSSPAVLLVMDRLSRDLYTAIKAGLPWPLRLQVALDVVQGIRFLHSQGLVHRDIKLKNVLLDSSNRAKITDLGFCKPEAMMSGSIVGTPIHMAPELFSGRYDNSVDVYAFGILFWYLCAGHARLPYVFEQCQNKDQLWQCVKRGARPERLPHFDDVCWRLMEECWAGEPADRPLLGHVEPRLENLARKYNEATDTGCLVVQKEKQADSLSSSPYIDVDLQPC